MRVDLPTIEVDYSAGLKTTEFYIPKTAGAKLAHVVVDGLYQSKIRWLAELVSNAFDETPYASRPPIIHLPTRFESWFELTDFGRGMSRAFMFGGYTEIFTSTKDEDDSAVGGFGIGRLSALAATQVYFITSAHAGNVDTYSVSRGANRIPVLTHHHSRPMEPGEPTGVKIRFDIENSLVQQVLDVAPKILAFFDPAPECNVSLRRPTYLMRTNKWAFCEGIDGPILVQGGYPYPIEYHSIPYQYANHSVRNLLDSRYQTRHVVLFAPVGTCDVTVNRESLQYSPKTCEALKSLAEGLIEDFAQQVRDEVAALPNQYAAAVWKNERFNLFPDYVRNRVASDLTYGDVKDFGNILLDNTVYKANNRRFKRNGDKDMVVSERKTFTPHSGHTYYLSDGTAKALRRFRAEMNKENNENIWLFSEDPKIDGMPPLLSVDDLPDVNGKIKGGGYAPPRLRVLDKWDNKFRMVGSQNPPDGCVLVRLLNNQVVDETFWTKFQKFRDLAPDKIYAAPSTWKGDDSKCITLDDALKANATQFLLDKASSFQALQWVKETNELSSQAQRLVTLLVLYPAIEDFSELPTVAALKTAIGTKPRESGLSYRLAETLDLIKELGHTVPKATPYNLKTLTDAVFAAYPILTWIFQRMHPNRNDFNSLITHLR